MGKGLMPPAQEKSKGRDRMPQGLAPVTPEHAVASTSDAASETASAAGSLSTIPEQAAPVPPPVVPQINLPTPSGPAEAVDVSAYDGPAVDVEQDPNQLYPPADPHAYAPLHDAMPGGVLPDGPRAFETPEEITPLEQSDTAHLETPSGPPAQAAPSKAAPSPLKDAATADPKKAVEDDTTAAVAPNPLKPEVSAGPPKPDAKVATVAVEAPKQGGDPSKLPALPTGRPKKPAASPSGTIGAPGTSSTAAMTGITGPPAKKGPPPAPALPPPDQEAVMHERMFGQPRIKHMDATRAGSHTKLEADDQTWSSEDLVTSVFSEAPQTATGMHGTFDDKLKRDKNGDAIAQDGSKDAKWDNWCLSDDQWDQIDQAEGGTMIAGGVLEMIWALPEVKACWTAYFKAKDEWKPFKAVDADSAKKRDASDAVNEAREKLAKAVLAAAASVLNVGSGAAKIASADGLHSDAASEDASAWSESIGAAGAIVSGITNLIDLALDLKGAISDRKKQTAGEKTEAAATIVDDVLSTGRDGMDAAQGIIKAASSDGATACAGLAKASGIVGLVAGAFEIAHGGLAWRQGSQMDGKSIAALDKLKAARSAVGDEKAKAESAATPDAELINKLAKLITELDLLVKEYSVTSEAMRTLADSKRAKGRMGVLTGTGAVATSVMMMAGVGMPVAIGLATATALLKGGHAIAKYRRGKEVESLQELALKVDVGLGGTWEDVSYREMDDTLKGVYYQDANYKQAVQRKPPSEAKLNADENQHVMDFVQEEKVRMARGEQKHGDLGEAVKNKDPDYWARVGTADESRERPKGTRRAKLRFKAAARKSKASLEASTEEVVSAILAMGTAAFDSGTGAFKHVPVNLSKTADATADGEADKAGHTTNAFLAAVNITAEIWAQMVKDATVNGTVDDGLLRKQVKDKVSGFAG